MQRRHTFVAGLLAATLAVAAAGVVFAQQGGGRGGQNAPAPGPPHDPKDLSGIWLGRAVQRINMAPPVFTPAGKAAFDANTPSFGPRAVAPATGNDPLGGANPPGIPRVLINHAGRIQFIPLSDKMVQLVEWNRIWREIFTDGRRLPEDPDAAWYGYSVGRWEGNEFVIDTIGLDARAWVDQEGHPKSEGARVQERYRRVDRDNLQVTVSVTDPKMYANPFGGDNRVLFRLQPNTPAGGFTEDIFAPIDEESFNERVRNPAGGIVR